MTIKHTLLFVVLALCPRAALAETATVYFNGDILTMEGDSPRYVEAVVVKGDEIAFAGDLKEARTEAGEEAEMHDLKGHTLLPGFIDTWGHFALVAQDTLGVNVSYFATDPPKTKAQLLEKLRSEGKPFNGWLVGTGYSEALLSDGALTLADLDEAFPDQPVLIADGRDDAIDPPKNSLIIANQIPFSWLAFFDGGHSFLYTSPKHFADTVNVFLQ